MLGNLVYVVAWTRLRTEEVNDVTLHKSEEGALSAVQAQVKKDTPEEPEVTFRNGCYLRSDKSVIAYLLRRRIER